MPLSRPEDEAIPRAARGKSTTTHNVVAGMLFIVSAVFALIAFYLLGSVISGEVAYEGSVSDAQEVAGIGVTLTVLALLAAVGGVAVTRSKSAPNADRSRPH